MTPSARLASIGATKAAEQHNRCYWSNRSTPNPIADHLVPPRNGGRWHDPLNIVAACDDCRTDRHAGLAPRLWMPQREAGWRAVWAIGMPLHVSRPRRKRRLSRIFERAA